MKKNLAQRRGGAETESGFLRVSATLREIIFFFVLLLAISVDAAPNKLNVLFIAIDDLRDELGCYGHKHMHTPNIDRLAARGMRFNRAYAQMALCWPSRNMVFSGMRLDSLGMKGPTHTFRKTKPDIVALPQLFKNHGYYTRSLGKILHHNGQDDPVSWTEPRFWPPAEKYQHPDNRDCRITVDRPANHRNPLVEWAEVADNVYQDGQTTDETIRTLRKVKDRPFMLMVGYMKPHTPFNAPKRYWDLYAPAKIKLAPNPFKPKNAPDIAMNGFRYVRSFRDIPENGSIPDDVYRRVRHAYYACVSYIDAQVGVLLDELDRLKLTDNTVIVLWSDHGYQLGEHGMICKHTNFETSTKVPLVFSFPGQETRGLATNSFAELIDIYPTLAELCGLPRPDHLEGASLVPVLNDPKKHVKSAAFSQYPRGGAMGRSIRVARYRYTEWRQQKTKAIVARELYDHRTDSMENVNIADDPPQAGTLERLSKQLQAGWRAAVVP